MDYLSEVGPVTSRKKNSEPSTGYERSADVSEHIQEWLGACMLACIGERRVRDSSIPLPCKTQF